MGGHVAGEAGLGGVVTRRGEARFEQAAEVPDDEREHRDQRAEQQGPPPYDERAQPARPRRRRGDGLVDRDGAGLRHHDALGAGLPRSCGVVPVLVM